MPPRWPQRVGERVCLAPSEAALFLVLALPLALLAAVIVRVDLGRPIFFSQTRSGRHNRPFTVMKFCTMREMTGPDGCLLPDALRETPVMRIVRRLRLDEIPQLVAIMRGDMGFVGPRPLRRATVAEFGELGLSRCAMRPGLTGWAQVNGNSRLTNRQKLAFDLWYVDNSNLALDLKILVLTAIVLLRGERTSYRNLARAMAAMRVRETPRPDGLPS